MSVPKSKRNPYKKEYISLTLDLIKKTMTLIYETTLIPDEMEIMKQYLLTDILDVYKYIEIAKNTNNIEYKEYAISVLNHYDMILNTFLYSKFTNLKITSVQNICQDCTKLNDLLQEWYNEE